ncbi:MAG: trypsin-like peptidase domain-containing protein [Spirochaetaceae bacterium]|jgi:S1-C subfamily serine protease|nr:trypsin-like peptidase domain-containing protein [Spirochaetaceae bacterium]
MKLYSRSQVVFIAVLTALVVGVFCLGAFFISSSVGASSLQDIAVSGAALPSVGTVQVPSPVQNSKLWDYSQDEQENITVYQKTNKAVVNITTEIVAYNWFLEPVPQESGSGSGSIISIDGNKVYVLTSNHVISNAYKVYVSLADESKYDGTVKGSDVENDLAVVEFEVPSTESLSTIPFGDSSGLMVGQKVLAIGNPFGYERTLTVGVVSALGRPIQPNNYIMQNMIQTDASINPGNSGGPLLDSNGRMIGINTLIVSRSGASDGVGFAVPVNTAKRVVADLIEYGRVKRGRIDATLVPLFSELVNYADLSVDSGLLVSRTAEGGKAAAAGLRQGTEAIRYRANRTMTIYLGGDIITKVNGKEVKSLADYYSALEESKPGDVVPVEINRRGRTQTLNITLADEAEL